MILGSFVVVSMWQKHFPPIGTILWIVLQCCQTSCSLKESEPGTGAGCLVDWKAAPRRVLTRALLLHRFSPPKSGRWRACSAPGEPAWCRTLENPPAGHLTAVAEGNRCLYFGRWLGKQIGTKSNLYLQLQLLQNLAQNSIEKPSVASICQTKVRIRINFHFFCTFCETQQRVRVIISSTSSYDNHHIILWWSLHHLAEAEKQSFAQLYVVLLYSSLQLWQFCQNKGRAFYYNIL